MGIEIPDEEPVETDCVGCIVDLPASLNLNYFDADYETWSGTIIQTPGTGTFFGMLWKNEEESLPGFAEFCILEDEAYILIIGAAGGGPFYNIHVGGQGCFTYASGTDLAGGEWYLNG